MTGNGKHLLSSSNSFIFDVSENISHGFDLSKFLRSVVWLNENIGEDNWFYDDMKYYFTSECDLVMFKLAILHEE